MHLNRNQIFQVIKPFLTELISSFFIEFFAIIVILNNGIIVQWSGHTIFWFICFIVFITYYIFTYQIFSFLAFVDFVTLSQEKVSVIIERVYPFRQGIFNDKNVFDKNGKVVVKEFLYYKIIARTIDKNVNEKIIFTTTNNFDFENNQNYSVTYAKKSKIILSIKKL